MVLVRNVLTNFFRASRSAKRSDLYAREVKILTLFFSIEIYFWQYQLGVPNFIIIFNFSETEMRMRKSKNQNVVTTYRQSKTKIFANIYCIKQEYYLQ